jgi:hypothetical protein
MFAVLALPIGILECFQVKAQSGDGSLSGRVTSPSGAPVANARLVLKNSASSETRSVTVNSDGTYMVPNLLPGTYEITASAQGFAYAHATVVISADGKPVANIVLQAGNALGAGKGQVGSSTVAIVTKPTALGFRVEGVVLKPLSDASLCFQTCMIMRTDDDSRLANEFAWSFLRRYADQRRPPKPSELSQSARVVSMTKAIGPARP